MSLESRPLPTVGAHVSPGSPGVPSGPSLLDLWLADRAPSTQRVYRSAVGQFADWLGVSLEALPATLSAHGRGPTTAAALAYRQHLMRRGCAVATRSIATAAVVSLVDRLRLIGQLDWSLELPRERVIPYRYTQGPGVAEVRQLLAAAARAAAPQGPRDVALITLAWGELLRRGELLSLDLSHVVRDAAGCPVAVWILGKGDRARRRVTLCAASGTASADWLAVRGSNAGPLFTGTRGQGLTGRGWAKRLSALAQTAGLPPVRPHGLRHAGITAALDAGLDVRRVRLR